MLFFQSQATELHRGVKQGRSGSEQGMGPNNKKQGVTSLPATALAAKVHVKLERVLFKEGDDIGVELSSTVNKAYKVLNQAM